MSATSPSPGATQTVPPPSVVTQFSQPPECTDLFRLVTDTTVLESGISEPTHNVTTSVFTSDSSNSRFSSCQPPGWDKAHMTFSPGLCPSGWTYNKMKALTTSAVTVSQAYCCAPDYYLLIKDSQYMQCQEVKLAGDKTQIRHHDAWFIKWQSSDKLPVSLPNLPTGYTVASWLPGESALLTSVNGYQPDDPLYKQYITVAVVVPIIFVALCTGCGVLCFLKRRKRNRLRREQVSLQELTGRVRKDGIVNL